MLEHYTIHYFLFFLQYPSTTEIYTYCHPLSPRDALPICFGGGSAIDVAKAIALMAGQMRPLADFEDIGDNWRRADAAAIAPAVAVPTTAGTDRKSNSLNSSH